MLGDASIAALFDDDFDMPLLASLHLAMGAITADGVATLSRHRLLVSLVSLVPLVSLVSSVSNVPSLWCLWCHSQAPQL